MCVRFPPLWGGGTGGTGLCPPLCIISEFLTNWDEWFLSTVCDEKRSSLEVCPVKRELSWCLYCCLQVALIERNSVTRVV